MMVYFSKAKLAMVELAAIVATVAIFEAVVGEHPDIFPQAARIVGLVVVGAFAGSAALGGLTLVALVVRPSPQLILSHEGIRQISVIGLLPVFVSWAEVKRITTFEYDWRVVPKRKELVISYVRSGRGHPTTGSPRVRRLKISSWMLRGSVDDLRSQIVHRFTREVAEHHIHVQ
jgi:hypothetical protein